MIARLPLSTVQVNPATSAWVAAVRSPVFGVPARLTSMMRPLRGLGPFVLYAARQTRPLARLQRDVAVAEVNNHLAPSI